MVLRPLKILFAFDFPNKSSSSDSEIVFRLFTDLYLESSIVIVFSPIPSILVLFLRNEPIHRMDNTWNLALEQERVAQRPQQEGHSPSLYHIVMNSANGKGRPYSPGIST